MSFSNQSSKLFNQNELFSCFEEKSKKNESINSKDILNFEESPYKTYMEPILTNEKILPTSNKHLKLNSTLTKENSEHIKQMEQTNAYANQKELKLDSQEKMGKFGEELIPIIPSERALNKNMSFNKIPPSIIKLGENSIEKKNKSQGLNSFISKDKNIKNSFEQKNNENFLKRSEFSNLKLSNAISPSFEKKNNINVKKENLNLTNKNQENMDDFLYKEDNNDKSLSILNLLSQIDDPNPISKKHNWNNLKDFQTTIDLLPSGETLHLPSKKIRIPSLNITKSLCIQGNSNSVLEITEGPIYIDIADAQNKVVFSECNIYFDLIPMNVINTNQKKGESEAQPSESNKSKSSNNPNSTPNTNRENMFPLFKIKGSSNVEIRDCLIKSKVSNVDIQDICFTLKSDDYRSNKISSLSLKSCTISNFYSAIETTAFSSFFVEKCYFSEIRNHCINSSNSYNFKIMSSSFCKIGKSCINLRFSRPIQTKRNGIIQENKFSNNLAYGVTIFTESLENNYDFSLCLNRNIFNNHKKEAIYIKNASISQIEISNNEIINSKKDGISLEYSGDFINESPILIFQNKIFGGLGQGISICDSHVRIEANEIAQNEKGGININGSEIDIIKFMHFKTHPIRILINECKIYENDCFGISVAGSLKGPLIISKCYLYENLNGVYVSENQQFFNKIERELTENNKNNFLNNFNQISLEKCSIFQNKRTGVFIDCLVSEAFISETLIRDNKHQAVVMSNQKDKKLIQFKDGELGKLRDFIQGFIGGPWGELFSEREMKSCKGNRCIIF